MQCLKWKPLELEWRIALKRSCHWHAAGIGLRVCFGFRGQQLPPVGFEASIFWCRKLDGTSHQVELVENDANHIRGALWELEHSHRLAPCEVGGGASQIASPGVDRKGVVPWHPNGAPFELTVYEVRGCCLTP